VILLDTTVLSNLARIGRLDLLRLALPDAVTTPQVLAELEVGRESGYLSAGAGEWPPAVNLAPQEEARLVGLRSILGDGEASCLAVLLERGGALFSDDLDARRYAQRHGIPVSGTLGVLVFLVEQGHLSLGQADDCLRQMIALGYRSPVVSLAVLRADLA
jgi:predicted nucleic acid-binding protein